MTVDYAYLRRQDQGRLLSLLAEETWSVSTAYGVLCRIVVSSAYLAVISIVLLTISWPLTVAAVAMGAVLFGLLNVTARPARRLGLAAAEVNQTVAEKVLHSLQGMKTIRAFAQESAYQQRFEAASADAGQISHARPCYSRCSRR
ncbi:conserved hypothetical protein, partial [Ricinus communis]